MRRFGFAMLFASISFSLFAQQSTFARLVPETKDAQASQAAGSVFIRQIDHIVFDSDTPEALFHLFSDKFELPVGFPYKSHGTFSSGGVGFGNVILEFINVQEFHPGLIGVAFEPATIEEAASALDARGVKHGAAHPNHEPGGAGVGWTTMDLDLPADGFFLCKYTNSVEPRRTRIRQEVDARKGGPLGVDSVSEVVVGVRDLASAQTEFRKLLGPPRQGEVSVWDVGAGPVIRIVSDSRDHLKEVRVKVHSLQTARAYLKQQDLLGAETSSELTFNKAKLGETNIVLHQ